MIKPDISGVAPFFIVNHVPAALAFYRDSLGFDITFQGPQPNDVFFGMAPTGTLGDSVRTVAYQNRIRILRQY